MMAPGFPNVDLLNLVNSFAERLLNTAIEGIVLAGLVWLLLRIFRRQASGTRFAICFATLIAIVTLPFLSGSSFVTSHLHFPPPANAHRLILLSSSWALILFAVWAVGAGVSLLRLSVGLWRVRCFRKDCSEVDLGVLDPAVAGILQDSSSQREVKLCVSSSAAIPAAVGFLKPAIVFPAGLWPKLSAEEIKTIVLHELAHLRRWDDWTNLAQKVVKAVFFFHPAVWWIDYRLTLEREMACDDMVLAQTANPRAYASSLISFAEKLHSSRGLALAQALVSRLNQMSLRLAQILDPQRSRGARLRPVMLSLSAGMFALTLGAAPYMPRIIAFRADTHLNSAQTAQRAVRRGEKPMSKPLEPFVARVAQRSKSVAQPRSIPAAFHLQTSSTPRVKAISQRAPAEIKTSIPQEDIAPPETIVILRTTQYDASGAAVWTLCVWRVGGNNAAVQQFESAIFVGLI